MEICNDRTVGCMRLQTKQKQQSLRVVVAVVEVLLYVHRNHRFIRDGEPRTATSTFTQLLNSDSLHAVVDSFSIGRFRRGC